MFFEDLPEYAYMQEIMDIFGLKFREVFSERHADLLKRRLNM
jgi:hypothetical protein